ncbi:MAG: hypothetical protein AAGJ86_12135 [Pseudomonadota bacterium]
MPLIRSFIILLLMCALAVNVQAAIPVEFERVDSDNVNMLVYRNTDGIEVRVKSLAALREDNSTDPDLRSDNARARLESGLYIMNLGMPEITGTLDDNPSFPIVEGIAYTEEGDEVAFVATWQGRVDEQVLVLVLSSVDKFDAQSNKKLVRKCWRRDYFAQANPSMAKPAAPTARAASVSKKTAVINSRYPVPARTSKSDSRWAGWHYVDDRGAVARADDANAPRARRFYKVAPTTKGPANALRLALKEYGVSNPRFKNVIETEIARQLVGDPNYIALGTSRLNGQEATWFAQIYQGKDSDELSVLVMEADDETYVEWGGVAAMLSATGVINHPTDIPTEYRDQLAIAPHDQQMTFYHMAYTQVMKSYLKGFMAANMSTVTMMQSINYDLLFDGTISLETITQSK